ncbi:MAG: hypothetical protein AAGN46_03510 [Acidobacteriota bacterium]
MLASRSPSAVRSPLEINVQRAIRAVGLAIAALVLMPTTCGGIASGAEVKRVDRIVAVVDEDPIFLSDVDRALRLARLDEVTIFDAPSGPDLEASRRAMLDELVARRLRAHEVDRLDAPPVDAAAVDQQLERLRDRLGGAEAFAERMRDLNADLELLRARLRRQLALMDYVERRLEPRILIDDDQIREYYEGALADELEIRGLERPPLDEVRDAIEALLTERALDEEIDEWTERLRDRADIDIRLDVAPSDPLPPVRERLGSSEAAPPRAPTFR